MSVEAALHAAEIRLRAERRIGELLPEKGTGHERGESKVRAADLDKRRAAEFRAIASIPEADFEALVDHGKEQAKLTTAAALRGGLLRKNASQTT